jgi:hypothetical protein
MRLLVVYESRGVCKSEIRCFAGIYWHYFL